MLNYVFKDAVRWDVKLPSLQCQQKCSCLTSLLQQLYGVIFLTWEFNESSCNLFPYKFIAIGSHQVISKKVQYTIKLGQTSRCLIHMLKAIILVCLSHYFAWLGILQAVWPRFFKILKNMKNYENRSNIFKCIIPLISRLIFHPQTIFSHHLLIFMSYQTLPFSSFKAKHKIMFEECLSCFCHYNECQWGAEF